MNVEAVTLPEVSEAEFTPRVLRAVHPVWVAFWAPWSEPCRVLLGVLKEIVAVRGSEVRIVTVNADESLLLSIGYRIHSIPTLLGFDRGVERARVVGTASREALLRAFRSCAAALSARLAEDDGRAAEPPAFKASTRCAAHSPVPKRS